MRAGGVGWHPELVTPRWSATGTFAEWLLSHFIWSFHRSLCFFRPRRTSAKATDGPCRVGSWDNWSPFASGDKAHTPRARPAQANRETGSGPVPSTAGPVAGPLYLLPDMNQEKIPLRGYKANGKFSNMYFTKLKRKTMEYISLVISDIHPKNLQTALIKGTVLKGLQGLLQVAQDVHAIVLRRLSCHLPFYSHSLPSVQWSFPEATLHTMASLLHCRVFTCTLLLFKLNQNTFFMLF